MTFFRLAFVSLRYHRRLNVALLFAVATTTSVLTGALLVGDSMTDSARDMAASMTLTGTDEGQFLLVWGPHEWTADFTVVR